MQASKHAWMHATVEAGNREGLPAVRQHSQDADQL